MPSRRLVDRIGGLGGACGQRSVTPDATRSRFVTKNFLRLLGMPRHVRPHGRDDHGGHHDVAWVNISRDADVAEFVAAPRDGEETVRTADTIKTHLS
ncbi:MAG: hypothetical protein P8L46_08155 [Acidimicrobiales bacterium]|nr:hypothetical protein [Acidimicrobiales bacterium]